MDFLDDKIDAYLFGKMNQNDKLDFEQKLKKDKELKEEVDYRKALLFVMDNRPLLDLDNQLQEVISESPYQIDQASSSSSGSAFNKLIGWSAAAALALGIGYFSITSYQQNQLTNYQTIVQNNLKPYENIFNFSPTENTFLAEGMKEYDNNNFDKAASLLAQEKPETESQFYLATAYLKTDKAEEAAKILSNLKSDDNPLLEAPIKWYLALAYLQIGEKNKSKSLLQQLQTDEEFGAKAKSILNNI